MKPLTLIIEDDASIRDLLRTAMELEQWPCLIAGCGREALRQAAAAEPGLVLLDLGLPDMEGLEVLKRLRTWTGIPVIVLSARTLESDKVQLLDAGADDYLTKPFTFGELFARMRLAVRHAPAAAKLPDPGSETGELRFQDLCILPEACQVSLAGKPLHLTPTEYRLLLLLADNAGKVMSYATLTNRIWGTGWDGDLCALRTNMANLRRKLGHRYIETRIGLGYIFSGLQ